MSDLSSIERIKLERQFDMEEGYVLDFSNLSFEAFFLENLKLGIYSEKYSEKGTSKAKRLRAFWILESNYLVGKSIELMIDYGRAKGIFYHEYQNESNAAECLKISSRLLQNSPVENIEAIRPINDDKDFSVLADSIRESISQNQPEIAIDRLHTFLIKYLRSLCDKHEVRFEKEVPLHSLLGAYIKKLNEKKVIESEMTERILKSSISVLESFNFVRNNHSFAHDNAKILNFNESMLIFNDISNVVKFIQAIEKQLDINEQYPF